MNSLRLELYNRALVEGDTLSGNVHLEVAQPFNATGVLVSLTAHESSKFQPPALSTQPSSSHQSSSGDGDDDDQKREQRLPPPPTSPAPLPPSSWCAEKRELCRIEQRVHPYCGAYGAGSYHFPFQTKIPDCGNSPTVLEDSGPAFDVRVRYDIRAWVESPEDGVDLSTNEGIVVNERAARQDGPSSAKETRQLVKPKGGSVSVRASLDRVSYYPGERVVVRVKGRSDHRKEIGPTRVSLVNELVMRAGDRERVVRRELSRSDLAPFPPCFWGVRFAGFLESSLPRLPSSSVGRLVRSTYHIEVKTDLGSAGEIVLVLPYTVLAPSDFYSQAATSTAPATDFLPPDVSYRPDWQPDSDGPQCNNCRIKFTMFSRRHHCRHCGLVFCSSCTSSRSSIPNLGYLRPERVCPKCLPVAQTGGVSRKPPDQPSSTSDSGFLGAHRTQT